MISSTQNRPPKFGEWLITKILRPVEPQEFLGDLEELYHFRTKSYSLLKSIGWFYLQVFRMLGTECYLKIYRSLAMFRNYIKIAIRNSLRHKGYTAINISGLAIGIAAVLIISLWVGKELSYDSYHKNADNIYRIAVDADISGNSLRIPKMSPPVTGALIEEYPEVLNGVRLNKMDKVPVKYNDQQFMEEGIIYADPSLFDVFSFPIVNGNRDDLLKAANSIVITENIAQKYFGDEESVGKSITVGNSLYTISAVSGDVPDNSHFNFDMVIPFENQFSNKYMLGNWMFLNHYVYIQLDGGSEWKDMEAKLTALVNKKVERLLKSIGAELSVYLQPLKQIHLHSQLDQELEANGDINYVYLFSAVSIFILLIACINFINLTTARSTVRAKEIGARKVSGAQRKELILQFLGESFLFSAASTLIGVLILLVSLPFFNEISDSNLVLGIEELRIFVPLLLLTAFSVGIISGLYPALSISKLNPITVFKGGFSSRKGKSRLRNLLVVTQFAISISLIIGSLVINDQLQFIRNKKLGFDKDQVILIKGNNDIQDRLDLFKSEFERIEGILSISGSSQFPGMDLFRNPYVPEGLTEKESVWMGEFDIDHDYIETLNIKITDGRNFSKYLSTEAEGSVLINEAAARKLGWKTPVGKKIKELQRQAKTVVGVIEDFHFESLHKHIEPLVLGYSNSDVDYIAVKFQTNEISGFINELKVKWKDIVPDYPFDYYFLDNSIDVLYRSDEKVMGVFRLFTFLAIVISCSGLLGLAAYITEQKTKETGIRKVLGASAANIFILNSRDFTKWILIANILAWPAAYYIIKWYLNSFAYRIEPGMGVFIFAGIISVIAGLFTIGRQAFISAVKNPVESLRYE